MNVLSLLLQLTLLGITTEAYFAPGQFYYNYPYIFIIFSIRLSLSTHNLDQEFLV